MKKNLLRLVGLVGAFWGASNLGAYSYTTFSLPYESDFPWTSSKYLTNDYESEKDGPSFKLNAGASLELGVNVEGRNSDNKKVDVYQIFAESNNIIPDSVDWNNLSVQAKSQLIALTNMTTLFDPGVDNSLNTLSVKFKPNTKTARMWDFTPTVRLALPVESVQGQLELIAKLPVKSFETKVEWEKDSANIVKAPTLPTPGGLTEFSTSALLSLMQSGRDGIDTEKFNETGIGDLNILLSWKNHYTQVNESLSSVGLFLQGGLILPTSKKTDPKKMLAIPFGFDNSIAIPLSGMVNLNFAKNFRLGVAGSLTYILDEESERFVKASELEDAYFLNNKFLVRRSPGVHLSFKAVAEAISSCKKYSAGIMYGYSKKFEDTLSLCKSVSSDSSSRYSTVQAAKMELYKEHISHIITGRIGVDFKEVIESDFAPSMSLQLSYPLRGERVVAATLVKLEASLNF